MFGESAEGESLYHRIHLGKNSSFNSIEVIINYYKENYDCKDLMLTDGKFNIIYGADAFRYNIENNTAIIYFYDGERIIFLDSKLTDEQKILKKGCK